MKNKAFDLIFRFAVDTSGGVEEAEGNGEARCVLHGPLNDGMEAKEKAECSALKVIHSLFFARC